MLHSETQKVEEIFYDAHALTDAIERSAFLKRACAGDEALRAKVEKMLATQAQAEEFFQQTSEALHAPVAGEPANGENGAAGADAILDEKPGTRIGPYKLLQKIGEGGCGVVYMAEQQEPMHRRVALKILKLGMDTKSVLARFRAEQQALALMDHPNIAQVLDAGVTDTGRPYFIMELVRGIKLTTYCDEHNLDTRQRLNLFILVCHAIQHAHQKGIIHRDIKPSNILTTMHDGLPVPKVIDFGIAKAVVGKLADETYFTAFDQFIGTPAYMSPEQAEMSAMDVDTRSDIYSLGVLLYELLTGKTPFNTTKLLQSGMDELRRTLREREPQRPSTAVATLAEADLTHTARCRHAEPVKLISLLRGDLDWIVMKALEKDRNRRYQTANGLAMDVQRYLDNEPIMARPPSQLYRLQKLVRRNKVLFAAGGITILALMVSSSVSTWLLIEERMARQRALMAEQQKGSLEKEASALRENAEMHRRLSEALALYTRQKTAEADALADLVTNPPTAPEYASMYRGLGDWHALNGRWAKARTRIEELNQINESQPAESTLDDCRLAVLLVDQGDVGAYDRFRESLVTRYADTANPTVAQRILRVCLLTPANSELLDALGRFNRTVEKSVAAAKPGHPAPASAWESYALALMAYRRGDYESVITWRQRLPSSGFLTRDLGMQLLEAMAQEQLGQSETALAELHACQSAINKTFQPGTVTKDWQGFWFDKMCVQIHLREAVELIEGNPN